MGIAQDILDGVKEIKKAMDEGIFDTDVYKALVGKHGTGDKVSDEDRKRIETMLALPDMKPYDEDGSLEAWLLRISLWGKIRITQDNPISSGNVKNREISTDDFLDHVDNRTMNSVFGKWEIKELAINKLMFYRTCWGIDGKNKQETITVEVALRPDLENLLKKARR